MLVADRDRDGLARLPALLDPADRLLTIEADLAEPDTPGWLGAEAERLLGGVDVLVNNAGLMRQTPALEITVAEWDELFAVNLRAVFFLTQAVAGAMAERGGGAVVSIASVNAFRTEAPEAHYNATKAGIVSVMRSFAIELAPPRGALQLRRAGRDRRRRGGRGLHRCRSRADPASTCSGCRCAASACRRRWRGSSASSPPTRPPT